MKECFNCGSYYNEANSTASDEYKDTYCTIECEQTCESALEHSQLDSNSTLANATAQLEGAGTIAAGNFLLHVKQMSEQKKKEELEQKEKEQG